MQAYHTGRGKICVRARAEIDEFKGRTAAYYRERDTLSGQQGGADYAHR